MTRIWAKREKQIEQVVNNTAGMYGDVQGLIGPAIQPIAALEAGHEFTEGEDGSEEEDKPEAKKQTVEEAIDPENIPF